MRTVCVTGMHRSGTSLLSRMVNLLGVDLGDQDSLLPPGQDNPAGYWERQDAVEVNNAIFEHFGGSWDRLPHLPTGWWQRDELSELRSRAHAVIESLPGDAELVGWKDPRLSILLPFWRSLVDIDQTVVAVRHPAAVAASLQRRNGLTLQHATTLWLRYTLGALVNDPEALVLPYDDMLSDSESTAQKITEYLGLAEPDNSTMEEIRAFAQPALAHQTEQFAPLSSELRFATEIFEEVTSGPDTRDLERFKALVTSWNEASNPGTGQLGELQGKLEEQRRQTRHHEGQVNRLRKQKNELSEKLQGNAPGGEDGGQPQRRIEELERALGRERRRAERSDLAVEFEQARLRRQSFTEQHLRNKVNAQEKLLNNRGEAKDSSQRARELREVQQSYDQLRNRLSVRSALAVARYVRPLLMGGIRVRNRVRRTTSTPASKSGDGEKEGSRGAPGPSDSATREPASRNTPAPAEPLEPPLQSAEPEKAESPETVKKEPRDVAETDAMLGALRAAQPVTILVPVYNAVDDLRRCVETVRRNTTLRAELLLIDDASPDSAVEAYLDSLKGTEGVRVLRNPENLGFSGTINRGIRESAGDVVVLNSDTKVTPRWLTNLALAAYSDPVLGSVTPLSDNAGAFSVPRRGEHNAVPEYLSEDEVGRLITRTSRRVRPDTPTANGFCMYLKRAMIDSVGLFDAESFPRGYGEENDYCMRAREEGWRHAVDDSTLIFHAGSMSFGEEKQALLKAGLAKVAELHPEYPKLVKSFLRGGEMSAVRETVGKAYDETPRCLPRVLHVIHKAAGGVQSFNEDLARGSSGRYEHLQLVSVSSSLTLRRYDGERWIEIERRVLETPVSVLDHRHAEYRREVTRILEEYGIELVHVQNLIYHSHDLPPVADTMGIPVAATLHDYFSVCPTIQLIDDKGHFCGGICTAGQGECRTGLPWVARDVPHLKHAWVHEWQRRLTETFENVDALVAPTEAVLQVYRRAYPELTGTRFETIEHGFDPPGDPAGISAPKSLKGDDPIRVLTLGNINDQKGATVLEEVLALDAEHGRIELHVLGKVAAPYRSLGTQHGPYESEELPALVEEISPHLVALLSPWGETFCYTLTEAWSCGVPVVASDLGALGERVRAEGGGWVVDPHDPRTVYETILGAVADHDAYRRAAEAAQAHRPKTVAEMAEDYHKLYRDVLDKRGLASQSNVAESLTGEAGS